MAKRVTSDRRCNLPAGTTLADAKQDAVVAALQVQHEYDPAKTPDVTFARWLYRRVLGKLQDKYGTQHRRMAKCHPFNTARRGEKEYPHGSAPQVDRHAATLTAAVEDPTERTDMALDLGEAIERLPDRQRQVVRAVLVEGRTQNEVAEELGVSQATVSQLLTAAKKALKVSLAAYA